MCLLLFVFQSTKYCEFFCRETLFTCKFLKCSVLAHHTTKYHGLLNCVYLLWVASLWIKCLCRLFKFITGFWFVGNCRGGHEFYLPRENSLWHIFVDWILPYFFLTVQSVSRIFHAIHRFVWGTYIMTSHLSFDMHTFWVQSSYSVMKSPNGCDETWIHGYYVESFRYRFFARA